ncbi:MAG TPA: asparagine synthase (glutamine-hydrolyzing) [Vicinamibacterales bacterium]|nr:asparagine synthase (glutamine-hydrolyzing) [Vicinamibacterales bacterium]
MCGITGFVGAGRQSDLTAMSAALRHRGPDGHGSYTDERNAVSLGHERLVVIDPAGGHQPMWNEDRSVAVVFNGEIYNAAELRNELAGRGHRFTSDHSDTEVLVHGFEQWGRDLPLRLNGMFAFAVYDAGAGRLFLARDRFGEKPLYYFAGADAFVFASELSAIRRHPAVGGTLDPKSIQKLFAYGYIPAPWTALSGVRKLPAGSRLEYDCRSKQVTESRYWTFHLEPDDRLASASEAALVEELRALLSSAVRRRLISDVPLGLFLSGGIDSATTLAFAAQHVPPSELSTFTVGFVEPSYDESGAAARVARSFGTKHWSTRLELEAAASLLPGLLRRLDEPLADPSLLPTYLLCRFSRETVTVALSGDGGDELFAGYDPFLALKPARAYARAVPDAVHALMRRAVCFLPHGTGYMSWDFRVRRTLAGLSYPPKLWNAVWLAPLEPQDMGTFFEDPLPVEELYEDAIAVWNAGTERDLCSRTLEFFTSLYLQNDILAKVDRASMMVSLESRAVFLDNDLVEFCRRLPNEWKLRRGVRKYLLRRALDGLVPREVLARRKQGFGVPVVSWLRQLPAPPDPPDLPGVKASAFRQAWQDHQRGHTEERLLLWTWLSLTQWAARPEFPEAATA